MPKKKPAKKEPEPVPPFEIVNPGVPLSKKAIAAIARLCIEIAEKELDQESKEDKTR